MPASAPSNLVAPDILTGRKSWWKLSAIYSKVFDFFFASSLSILLTCGRAAYSIPELGFGFYQINEHPHKFLLYFIKYLSEHGMSLGKENQLAQHAWAYLNDSMRLDLCLRHPANHLACAAILMASRHPGVSIVLPSPQWIIALGANPEVVHVIVDTIQEAYSTPIPVWLEPIHAESYLRHQGLFDAQEEGRPLEGRPARDAGDTSFNDEAVSDEIHGQLNKEMSHSYPEKSSTLKLNDSEIVDGMKSDDPSSEVNARTTLEEAPALENAGVVRVVSLGTDQGDVSDVRVHRDDHRLFGSFFFEQKIIVRILTRPLLLPF